MINQNKIHEKTWAITTFFNSERYRNKIANYDIFRKHLTEQGVPLLTIECAFKRRRFELHKADADILILVRSNALLWQKERLLNIALKHLPKECENIVWIDADIVFLDNQWMKKTEQLLETYAVVQPFARVVHLGRSQSVTGVSEGKMSDGQIKKGYAYFLSQQKEKTIDYATEGGFAWAGKKTIFEACGFYDQAIVGGADWIMNHAFVGIEDTDQFSRVWFDKMRQYTKGKYYFTEGTIVHLYHGSLVNRFYEKRASILSRNHFDAAQDLRLNADGCWEWSTKNAQLKKEVEKYFMSRNEDDDHVRYKIKLSTHQVVGWIGSIIRKISPKLYDMLKNSAD